MHRTYPLAANLAPVTRDEWIAEFAREAGVDRPGTEQIRALLDLAGAAAHGSERTAAPLACWIAGRSQLSIEDLQAAAARVSAAGETG
jgi:Domain of unknown function (DUF6457)